MQFFYNDVYLRIIQRKNKEREGERESIFAFLYLHVKSLSLFFLYFYFIKIFTVIYVFNKILHIFSLIHY